MQRITLKAIFATLMIGSFTNSIVAQRVNDGFDPVQGNDVNAIATLPNGHAIIGGAFLGPRPRLARLRPGGNTEEAFNANVTDGWVETLAIDGIGNVIFGGNFTNVGGQPRPRLARVSGSSGALDPAFVPQPNDTVFSLCIQGDGKVVIAGSFTMIGTTPRNRIARLNPDGSVDPTFDPNANDIVWKVHCDNRTGRVYASGPATAYGGVSKRIVRFLENGRVDPTFNFGLGPDLAATAFAVQVDGRIVVGHGNGVVRVNTDGSVDPSLNYSTGSWVTALSTQIDGKVVVGGYFTSLGATPRNRVARINVNGTVDTLFNPNVETSVPLNIRIGAVTVGPDRKIYIGGRFDTVGGIARQGIARVYPDGALDRTANPNFAGGPIAHITPLSNGWSIVAGDVSSIGGVPVSKIAMINNRGEHVPGFEPPAVSGGWIQTVLPEPFRYLIGGEFTSAGGSTARKYLFRVNSGGSLDTSFNIDLNGPVFGAARLANGQYIICGAFTSVNSTTRNRIARINADGSLDTSFNASASFYVNHVAIQADGKILIGGPFSTINGVARNGIARLNADGTLDTGFAVTLGGVIEPEVTDIVIYPDGSILFGGAFTTVNGITRTYLARVNASGTLDTTFNVTLDSTVLSIALEQRGNIVIGGRFLQVNGSPRTYIAKLTPTGSSAAFVCNANDVVLAVETMPDGKLMAGGWFSNLCGSTRNRLGRIQDEFEGNAEYLSIDSGLISILSRGPTPGLRRVQFQTSNDLSLWSNWATGTFQSIDNNSSRWFAVQPPSQNFVRVLGHDRDHSAKEPRMELIGWFPPVQPLPSFGAPFDLDGDGKTDISIFRPGPGEWWYLKSSDGGNRAFAFGSATDTIVPADFTGDGKADIAFWRPATGEWFVLRSEDSTFFAFPFGANGDVPSPADYDGDGKSDAAVFRPSNSTWFVRRSSDSQVAITPFGVAGDRPVPADYDGDGKADVAVFRPGPGQWWYLRSSDGGNRAFAFGSSTDLTVPGDYTGDGKADIAYFRPSTAEWFILRSEDSSFYAFPWGSGGDVPAPGDYDGDGKIDAAVFRPSSATWFVNRSTQGVLIQQFGITGDRPVPNAFVR